MFGNLQWPWATSSRISTPRSPPSAILSQTTPWPSEPTPSESTTSEPGPSQPTPSEPTTAPEKFHAHLNKDDIDKLYDELRGPLSADLRYTAPPDYHVEEAESQETWSYTCLLIIGKLEEHQQEKAKASGWTEVYKATTTDLHLALPCHLPSYARSRTVVEFPANPADIEEFRARMKEDLPKPSLEAESVEVEDSPVAEDAGIDSAVSSAEVNAASATSTAASKSQLVLGPIGVHTEPDGGLGYIPSLTRMIDRRKACIFENKRTTAKALDGTPWGLSLHGNQWFRPFQYTGQNEISTWILKNDEPYFSNFPVVNGVIKLPYSEATKIFAQKPIAMFAFRLTYGLLSHAHIAQAKVLLSFMARLCCDLHALKERQAGYQVGKAPADAFVWPDNGPFEVDATLATRVVITEVTMVALIPRVLKLRVERVKKSNPGGSDSRQSSAGGSDGFGRGDETGGDDEAGGDDRPPPPPRTRKKSKLNKTSTPGQGQQEKAGPEDWMIQEAGPSGEYAVEREDEATDCGVVADDDTYTSDASSTDTADSEGFPQYHRGARKGKGIGLWRIEVKEVEQEDPNTAVASSGTAKHGLSPPMAPACKRQRT